MSPPIFSSYSTTFKEVITFILDSSELTLIIPSLMMALYSSSKEIRHAANMIPAMVKDRRTNYYRLKYSLKNLLVFQVNQTLRKELQ